MLRAAAITLLALSLGACSAGQDLADNLARDKARSVVIPIVEKRIPAAPAAPIAECVIDNASVQEILLLAKASVVGASIETTDTVITILKRPDTLKCIAVDGIAPFLI